MLDTPQHFFVELEQQAMPSSTHSRAALAQGSIWLSPMPPVTEPGLQEPYSL